MKFAKELEDDLVPEWRVKYLDYKLGKKKIKAVSRALRNANRTPRIGRHTGNVTPLPFTHYDFQQRSKRPTSDQEPLFPTISDPASQDIRPDIVRQVSKTLVAKSPPILADTANGKSRSSSTQPLNIHKQPPGRMTRYGSIIGSPPDFGRPGHLPQLELPDPALDPNKSKDSGGADTTQASDVQHHAKHSSQRAQKGTDAYHVGPQHHPSKTLHRTLFRSHRSQSYHAAPQANTVPRSKIRRLFSATNVKSPSITDVQLDAYKELDARQDEFFDFLDEELEKIDSFYKMKEKEASKRLEQLRNQLHIMRDRRVEEMREAKNKGHLENDRGLLEHILPETELAIHGNGHRIPFLKPFEKVLRGTTQTHVGKTSKAMKKLASPDGPQGEAPNEDRSDYVRRKTENEHIPYRFAKRRLKLALQEFYRAMELLKSYTLLNRTGFRKINKKYDKAVNARPTGRYMSEKVNNAYFVQSNVIEGHLVAVEDLYSRYFERGNHKIAVTKLRSKRKTQGQSGSAFRNGFFIAAGIALGLDGLVRALSDQHAYHPDPVVGVQAAYLLQIYAAYFLVVLLFLVFVLNCKVWAEARVNYVFIFEYDTRHVLDWRQLAELPCFFLFLNGLFLWLNFRQYGPDAFYIYWPVLLSGITLLIMIWPFPMLYHNARKWWGVSNWRLLCAGLYPVEFRDFYLGDMYCSETYAMSQFELFFCLYAQHWQDPPRCNSNHSRLLGFFTTLPAIWRALQCLRRYYDSRNWFPHLANFAKYLGNITYYMTLSLYRMNLTPQYRAVFITFAAINGFYCSFWDVAMDFSLGNPYAEHPFLRDRLAYRRVWVYYAAIITDIILRQQWIFYALYQHDLQHAAALSFFVSLAEVLRRGMWSLFRVENEHCNNVDKFRASRDIPLPYHTPGKSKRDDDSHRESLPQDDDDDESPPLQPASHPASSGVDVERAGRSPGAGMGSSLRQRKTRPDTHPTPAIRAIQRVGTLISSAHAQDFEKRKKPGDIDDREDDEAVDRKLDSSSDDDEEHGDHGMERTSDAGTDTDEQNALDVMHAQRMLSRGQG